MRLVVDGVEIADSKVVEMVATSTGAAPEGLAPRTSGDPGSGGGRYAAGQYGQYQYADHQYGEAQRDRYEYASPQYAETSQYDGPEVARLGQGSDDEAASATPPSRWKGMTVRRRRSKGSRARRPGRTEPRSGRIPVKGARLGRTVGSSCYPRPGCAPRGRSVGRSLALARPRGVSDPQNRRPRRFALDGAIERRGGPFPRVRLSPTRRGRAARDPPDGGFDRLLRRRAKRTLPVGRAVHGPRAQNRHGGGAGFFAKNLLDKHSAPLYSEVGQGGQTLQVWYKRDV